VVSLADADSTKAFAGGTLTGDETYLVVGRLYKSAPLDDDYNRFDLWVNPTQTDQDLPHATAQRNRGTGSLLSLSAIGFSGASQFSPAFYDRIRIADSWTALFENPDGDDGDTDAGGEDPLQQAGAEVLGSDNGITLLVNGERQTAKGSPPLLIFPGFPANTFNMIASTETSTLNVNLTGTYPGVSSCDQGDSISIIASVSILGVRYVGSTGCTVEVLSVNQSESVILGTFFGTFRRETGEGTIEVTGGRFQYSPPN